MKKKKGYTEAVEHDHFLDRWLMKDSSADGK